MRAMIIVAVAVVCAAAAGSNAQAAAPFNDAFASAEAIGADIGGLTETNVDATKEIGEPNHAGDPGGHSVWYSWVAPRGGNVTFETCGSDFDTLLAVYTGSAVDSLTEVKASDDGSCSPQSSVTFAADASTDYRIAVDGKAGATGTFELSWVLRPPNDNFTDAKAIGGAGGGLAGTNSWATKEVGEPDHAATQGGSSVWFSWTAPADAATSFDTCGSDFDALLAVYTGSALDDLTGVAANDDSSDPTCGAQNSRVNFTAAAGTTYKIAVDGYLGDTGPLELHWRPLPPASLAPPVVSGPIGEGSTLSVTPGGWSGGATSFGYQWQRCGRLDNPASNAALGAATAVSAALDPDHLPKDAVDGNFYTYWGAGDYSPEWFSVDLGAPYPLNKIRAAITQLPDGNTVHQVWVKGPQPTDSYVRLTQFSGFTRDQQVLEWTPSQGWVDGIRFVLVETTASPSWVGWREIEAYTNCVNVPGGTGSSYAVTHGDIGYMLRVVVTATSGAGSTTSVSQRTAVVPYVAPANTARPMLSGLPRVGKTLTATPGQWSGTQPFRFAYQWQRCRDRSARTCNDIPDARAPAYRVKAADVASSIRVLVTASNDAGSAAAPSATAAAIPRPIICRVPNLKRKPLASAKQVLKRSHCTLGKVHRRYSRKVRKGRVTAQSPSPGVRLRAGGKVNVVVSRGRRR